MIRPNSSTDPSNQPDAKTLLNLRWTCALASAAEMMLLGLDADGNILVEEISDNDELSQTTLTPEGQIVHQASEESAHWRPVLALQAQPLVPAQHRFNFSGPRYRGLRHEERIAESVQALSIADKMRLVPRLGGQIAMPMILGIIESRVLSLAPLRDDLVCLCRRIRVACALPETRTDENGPYDYDCVTFYIAHLDDGRSDAVLPPDLDGLAGQALYRPIDCLAHEDRLYIADAGAGHQPNHLHRWDLLPAERKAESA